jgi:hypothetical protein
MSEFDGGGPRNGRGFVSAETNVPDTPPAPPDPSGRPPIPKTPPAPTTPTDEPPPEPIEDPPAESEPKPPYTVENRTQGGRARLGLTV